MKKKVMCWAEILLVVLVSCAVITVNVYFPEKDVKEAYKTLEKELATPGNPERAGTGTENQARREGPKFHKI